MVLLLTPRTRGHPFWRMVALGLIVIGVIAYRWDTNLSGLLIVMPYLPGGQPMAYVHYSPSLIELAAGMGVIAYGLLAFSLGVRYLNIVNHRMTSEQTQAETVQVPDAVPA